MYQPEMTDEVIRLLYREAKRRKIPMTKLINEILRAALEQGEETA